MPSLSVMKVMLKEMMTSQQIPRTPEPTLVMDDPEQVRAYTRAGREDGVMAPVYLFHGTQVCQIIRPGERVLDLACGPATQLCLIARLNPDCHFTGLDLSPEMLVRARELVASMGLDNVDFMEGSITDLSRLTTGSMDAVMSTMALHHLPNTAALDATYREAARVLKPDGGLYLADFGRLKRADSIDYFANQYQDRQPPLFTLDYFNSLHAAFTLQDFQHACKQAFGARARVQSTWNVPYMVVTKTEARRDPPDALKAALGRIHDAMPDYHQRDFADLSTFFGLGGVRTPELRH